MDMKRMEILEKATQVFLKYGIKSVTMDDMARELGMSKKTLYAHFSDKNDLVVQIIKAKTAFDREQCAVQTVSASNAIEEMLQVSMYVQQMMRGIHPSVFFDLRKFHPEAWQIMHQHKWEFVFQTILANIRRGKSEGIYRAELKDEIIATVYVGATDLLSDTDAFINTNHNSDEVFQEIILFQLNGMANEKGRVILNEMNKQQRDEQK